MKNKVLPMKLQFFAEPGAGGNQPPAGETQPPQTPPAGAQPPQFDYDKLASLITGKQTVAEETVLKGYFKQQGLSKEQMDQAIMAFKQQQAANTPDVGAMQAQLTQAQAIAQQATIEKEAMFMAGELGVELQTMPYVLKLADLSNVSDAKGVINKETLKVALNKVLEELPQLKPTVQNQQSGFRQIGSGGQGSTPNTDDQLAAIFGNKK